MLIAVTPACTTGPACAMQTSAMAERFFPPAACLFLATGFPYYYFYGIQNHDVEFSL
jgi:hypothetical protein